MKRVVITGFGVVAPNGIGPKDFEQAIRSGDSGIRHIPELEELKFRCTVAGIPPVSEELLHSITSRYASKKLRASGVIYALLAALQAWEHAGLELQEDKTAPPLKDCGCAFGTGLPGIEVVRDSLNVIDAHEVRRLGSTSLPQSMSSAPSAFIGGLIGLGNWVTSISSACCSGTDSIITGWRHIQSGGARIMLCGGTDGSGPYIWGGFDSMRVMNSRSNDHPKKASMPMNEAAAGFVPGGGSAALVLEELGSALERNAPIYGEITGGFQNSGGQREKGTMTAPSFNGIVDCIEGALDSAGIHGSDIDLICGHLTSTRGDVMEVAGWAQALNVSVNDFPYINSLKSMTGHCLSAAGSIETVAALLQLNGNYIHPNLNLGNIHPEILKYANTEKIPANLIEGIPLNYVAKANFGFGDVNTCLIIKKFQTNEQE